MSSAINVYKLRYAIKSVKMPNVMYANVAPYIIQLVYDLLSSFVRFNKP